VKVTALNRIQFNCDTNDERWGDGLYDYRDLGGAADFNYKLRMSDGLVGEFMGTVEYYMRVYPNYKSLISLISATAPEKNEKDYNGYQLITGWRFSSKKFSGEVKYIFLVRAYTDKKVIGEDGVLDTSVRRLDSSHAWNAGIQVPLTKRVTGRFDSQLALNNSNQNFYDARGSTLNFSDDVFTKRYYDYYSAVGGPGITYRLPLGEKKEMLVDLGYEFTYRHYIKRKAQEKDSTYTTNCENDFVHAIRGLYRYPLTEHVSFLTVFSSSFARSNMDYERYYRYDYDLYRVACGINIRY
jgi:hypothetical protein